MSRIAYVNGRYRPLPEAAVNVEDRGFQFGDGVYEVVYAYRGALVDEGLHLDRLERSLGEIRIAMPCTRAALGVILRETLRRNRLGTALLYIQVSRGAARREHAFPASPLAPSLIVTARAGGALPASADAWAIGAVTRPDQRWGRCDIKSTNLLPNVLAKQEARQAGAYEAIFIDEAGRITEGASTSVWLVDAEGRLRTRALDNHILPGCTRAALMALLREHGIDYAQAPATLADLRAAREIFLTSATSFVKPVIRLDGEKVGDGAAGPVATRLLALITRHIEGGANHR